MITVVASTIAGVFTLVAALYAARISADVRRQTRFHVADRRMDAYAALWATMRTAAPMDVTPLTGSRREELYDAFTDWYFAKGNGMFLTETGREIYLATKRNLTCDHSELFPESLRGAYAADAAGYDVWRGELSKRQLSLLRTQMKADVEVYGLIYADESTAADQEFLVGCGADITKEPWVRGRAARRSPRAGSAA